MRPSKKTLRRFILAVIIFYFTGGLVFYLTQDLFLFHPKPVNKNYQYAFDIPFEETNTSFEGNNLNIIRFKTAGPSRGIVLFFHGNMENVERYKKYPSFFTQNQYELWMIDYPGFGKTTGKITEQLMYQQALFMYGKAANKFSNDSIIIYGKSIGTGIASYLASKKPCSLLILETPYYNLNSLVKSFLPIYPVSWLLKYSFPNNQYLKNISAPVTIFHGTDDEVIPYRHARKLKKENPRINLVTIEKGKHNDLFEKEIYGIKMEQLLNEGH